MHVFFSHWLLIGCIWIGLLFFVLSVAQTLTWFTNFARHFLQGEPTGRYVNEFLGNALPRNSSDFKWGNIVDLMSYVSKSKHNNTIPNVLGSWPNNFKYPTLAKRYFPVDEPTTLTSNAIKNTVLLTVPTFSGILLFGMRTKLRVNIIEEIAKKREDTTAKYNKNIIQCQEQRETFLKKLDSYLYHSMLTKEQLEKKGIKNIKMIFFSDTNGNNTLLNGPIFGPFSFEDSRRDRNENEEVEIKKLFLKLKFFKGEYFNTLAYLRRLLLREASLKKIIDCDITVINLNPIERLFSSCNQTFYRIPGLGLNSETLLRKAEKNHQIQALLEEALPIQECSPLNLEKIDELFVKINPFLDSLFDELQKEFKNRNMSEVEKQHSANSNPEKSNDLDE